VPAPEGDAFTAPSEDAERATTANLHPPCHRILDLARSIDACKGKLRWDGH
jgi:hypothetical protein